MNKLRLQLRAVIYHESGDWIAHCLEMDVMGHGQTKDEALCEMTRAISLQLSESIEHGNRANIFMPADSRIFEMYSAGDHDRAVASVDLGVFPKRDDVEVDRLDLREFAAA